MCTPFGYRDVWQVSRVALLTAFATGKLIVVLPILIDETERLFAQRQNATGTSAAPTIDVLYPLAYTFPHLGKLMGMLFIPFAAWFFGREMRDYEYPAFLLSGLFSYFGGPVLATPFLLDQMHLPHDMFQLFILSGRLLWATGRCPGSDASGRLYVDFNECLERYAAAFALEACQVCRGDQRPGPGDDRRTALGIGQYAEVCREEGQDHCPDAVA